LSYSVCHVVLRVVNFLLNVTFVLGCEDLMYFGVRGENCYLNEWRGRRSTHTHTRHTACLSLLFPLPLLFLVRSPLSLLFPFLSHLSALTIQFMTMNAGELLANSLSSGNVLCRPLSVLRPSRPSASPSPSTLPFRIPHNSNSHPPPLPLSDQATRENATQKLEQASRENYVRRTFLFIVSPNPPPSRFNFSPFR
jgi:hypothetical protein